MTRVGLVWAQSADGWIGRDGTMPWHVPEDLAHFRALTGRSPVLMGRSTWESLPERYRPLPRRRNVVLSRRPGLTLPGAEVARSVEGALALLAAEPEIWVIGGAAVYEATLPVAEVVERTDLDLEVAGDTPAPVLGAPWRPVHRDPAEPGTWHLSTSGVRYRFVRLEPVRTSPAAPEVRR